MHECTHNIYILVPQLGCSSLKHHIRKGICRYVYKHMYKYMHTQTTAHLNITYERVYVGMFTNTCISICILTPQLGCSSLKHHIWKCICRYVCIPCTHHSWDSPLRNYICIYIYTYISDIYRCIFRYIYICIYTYIHTQTTGDFAHLNQTYIRIYLGMYTTTDTYMNIHTTVGILLT
jgi:hypothetical protein